MNKHKHYKDNDNYHYSKKKKTRKKKNTLPGRGVSGSSGFQKYHSFIAHKLCTQYEVHTKRFVCDGHPQWTICDNNLNLFSLIFRRGSPIIIQIK